MASKFEFGLRGWMLASASVCAMAIAPSAAAETCNFDLAAQPLRTGLPEYGRQAGLQILAPDADVRGLRGNALRGAMDCRAALDVLLAGADLRVVSDDGRTITLAAGQSAAGESAAAPAPREEAEREIEEEIIVVGSQIRGARATASLPVTIVSRADIDASAALSGDDLFRSIPQIGEVAFNESRTVGGVNDARGDVASINLRSLGTGNTLVLINGRRMVLHPGTQAENLVPVTTVNTNSIPVMGVQRIEVLRDGASAIYGTDAVAGVVNTVLKSNFEGFAAELQYGGAEGADMRELTGSFELGFDIIPGRTNFSLFGAYTDRDPLFARERDYSRSADQRPLLSGDWVGDTDFRGTSTSTPWGTFDRVSAGAISQNGAPLTNAAGQFHIQPNTLAGCLADLGDGLCVDDATAIDEDLRYNINDERTISGGVERVNLFGFFNHEFEAGFEFFGEMGIYYADYRSFREQAALLSATPIAVPAGNYYNPFGPTTLNGAPNPNRLPGLDIPDEGVDILLVGYRPIDVGPRAVTVEDFSSRALAGFRGVLGGWDWETAYLYSAADTDDTTHNLISNTLFQRALARSTPDAYNPFNGGDPANPSAGDATANSEDVLDSFRIDVFRKSHTSLAQWDFRLSRPDLLQLPAGGVGAAVGVEIRRETFRDDRDPRLDGTISFTDPITGNTGSDVMGSSPTNDTSGARTVHAAYLEFAVPLVSPDMNVPLVYALDAQLAGRFEDYSLFGDVAKPKVALSWRPFEFLQFRTAWSQGFRAPNLQQLFETGLERVNTRTDYVRCEADVRAGRIANFDACDRSQPVTSQRAGSQALEPEESENFTAGLTLETPFAPQRFGSIVFTADYWRVEQERIVGIFGDANQIALDYLLRTQGGSNPAVVRAAPDAQDQADFMGTGLAPVGDILFVDDNYRNLLPREVEGVDYAIFYTIDDTRLGDFSLRVNAAQLLTFFQDPSSEAAAIIAAQQAGEISSGFTVAGANSLLRQDGRPKWRWTGSLTWRLGPWGAGWYSAYVGSVLDPGATLADGTVWLVDDWLTHNLYVQYTIGVEGDRPLRMRVGARNIADEGPPLAPADFGYNGELHNARGRFLYASVRKSF